MVFFNLKFCDGLYRTASTRVSLGTQASLIKAILVFTPFCYFSFQQQLCSFLLFHKEQFQMQIITISYLELVHQKYTTLLQNKKTVDSKLILQ